MNKIKKLLLFYILLNAIFFAILTLLATSVKELTIETVFPLLLPWILFGISSFTLAGDYEPSYLPAKRFNCISLGIRGVAIIVSYCCIGYYVDKGIYYSLISVLAVLFVSNLALDILSVKTIIKHIPETKKVFLKNIEIVTEEDVKNIHNYRKSITKSMCVLFLFYFSFGLIISFGINLNLIFEETLNIRAIFMLIIECILIIWWTIVSYKNLIIRTKLYYNDSIQYKNHLQFELTFLTLAYMVTIGCGVIGFIDSLIQFFPLIVGVLLLIPIFTNRCILIKYKFTEAKVQENNFQLDGDLDNTYPEHESLEPNNTSTENKEM